MSRIIITFFCFLSIALFSFEKCKKIQAIENKTVAENDTSRIKLIFVGDVMGHEPQIRGAYNPTTKSYNYEPCFQYLSPYLKSADIAVANLEVTLGGEPYDGYPTFSSPDALAEGLKKSGFTTLVTANNHSMDTGKRGLLRTITMLDSLEIPHTGTFKDSTERISKYPLLIEKKGFRIALLNCTYGTNGIAVPAPVIVNLIDTVQVKADLAKAKASNPDFIIMAVHWGSEYQLKENKDQTDFANFLISNGVDAVIGAHPHVVQPIKYYYSADSTQKKLVVYSLGNFISNQRDRYKNGGLMIELNLSKVNSKTKIEEVFHTPVWVWKRPENGVSKYTLIPSRLFEKDFSSFKMSKTDSIACKTFLNDTREQINNVQESEFYK